MKESTPTRPEPAAPRGLSNAGRLALLVVGACFIVLVAAAWSPVNGLQLAVLAAAIDRLCTAGALAGGYITAAIGFGLPARRLIVQTTHPLLLQTAIGLSALLTLSHLAGALGMFAMPHGRFIGIGMLAIGIALAAGQFLQWARRRPSTPAPLGIAPVAWGAAAALPISMLTLVAACSPPGWLWASEFGGFDALSYHLQLPKEWLALGVLRPLEHNVYSYLPSYIEAAYMHLGALSGSDLLHNDGVALVAAQMLHAMIGCIGALMLAAAADALLSRAGVARAWRSGAAAIAACLGVGVPWVVVTGSLAYNELGVNTLIAAACLVALQPRRESSSGLLVGWLCGVACCCKPTALFLGAPVAGALLLSTVPPARWARALVPACVTGLAALAPWLIRNALYGGNPVFPQAASLFGSAHWDASQVARYISGHAFSGSWADRLALLVAPDRVDHTHRGLFHPQWAIFFPLVAFAIPLGLARPNIRRDAAALAIGLVVGLIAWLALTHIQSRFLMPLIVPGAILVAVVIGAIGHQLTERAARDHRRPIAAKALAGAAAGAIITQPAWALVQFTSMERGGRAAELIPAGADLFTGRFLSRELAEGTTKPADRTAMLTDLGYVPFCNYALPPNSCVYLLGDSTPLYFSVPVLYHTTWDRSPLADLMRTHPEQPAEWVTELRSRGITHVLVNLGELDRLQHSHWYDPLVTPRAAAQWLAAVGTPVQAWPQASVALYALPEGATQSTDLRPSPAGGEHK